MKKGHIAGAAILGILLTTPLTGNAAPVGQVYVPMGGKAEPSLNGFYLGAGLGTAALTLEGVGSMDDFRGDDSSFKVVAGYRILKWLAVEANYADYGTPVDNVFGQQLEGDFDAFSVTAVGFLPLGSVDLFARGGFAAWQGSLRNLDFGGEFSEDNVDPIIGIGVQYRFGRMGVRAEYEGLLLGFDDDDDDRADGDDWITTVTLGVTWTF